MGSRSKGNDFATADNALASAALHKEASTELNIAKDKIKGLSAITELISEDQFDLKGFANVSSEGELGSFLNGYIIKKEESIDKTWKDLHENPEGIYELNELMTSSKAAQQIEKGSIFDLIINDKIEELGGDKLLEAICAVVIGIALIVLNIVSLGASTGLTVAVATATLGVSAYFVDEAIAEYKAQDAANDVGFLTDDPSYLWVLIAILGAVADVAAFTKVLRSASKIKEAVDVLDEAEGFAKFENKLKAIVGLEQKVKENLINQALLKNRITVVAAEIRSTANSGINPKLFEYAFLSIKNGITTFDSFIKELKLAKLIKETGLSSEELMELKAFFNQAKLLSKDKRLMVEFEKALAEKNFEKIKEIIDIFSKIEAKWKLSLQKLGRSPSSPILGENLEAFGKARPANSHAHHITAGGSKNPDALASRQILQNEGIDINEASNGVFLPSSSKYAIDDATPHANVHTDIYYSTVRERLESVQSGKVRDELQRIAEELVNGIFPY